MYQSFKDLLSDSITKSIIRGDEKFNNKFKKTIFFRNLGYDKIMKAAESIKMLKKQLKRSSSAIQGSKFYTKDLYKNTMTYPDYDSNGKISIKDIDPSNYKYKNSEGLEKFIKEQNPNPLMIALFNSTNMLQFYKTFIKNFESPFAYDVYLKSFPIVRDEAFRKALETYYEKYADLDIETKTLATYIKQFCDKIVEIIKNMQAQKNKMDNGIEAMKQILGEKKTYRSRLDKIKKKREFDILNIEIKNIKKDITRFEKQKKQYLLQFMKDLKPYTADDDGDDKILLKMFDRYYKIQSQRDEIRNKGDDDDWL
jgi:hypothetical protein